MSTPVVLYEQEYEQLKHALTRLCTDANAKFVFLVDKNGQQIAAHGEMLDLDTTSLASRVKRLQTLNLVAAQIAVSRFALNCCRHFIARRPFAR